MMSFGFIANLKLMRKGLIENCRPMANPSALLRRVYCIIYRETAPLASPRRQKPFGNHYFLQ